MLRLYALFAVALLASGCSTPQFEFETLEMATIGACRDGALSPGEADVDCGAVCSVACATGSSCSSDLDCASAFCAAGTCREQTCNDTLKNQRETDIDCGGDTSCARCGPGSACSAQSDCDGGACNDGKCFAPSCNDSLLNQSESDVDCGGTCGSCATGMACHSADDCNMASCTGGKCRAQTCADGIENQDETDVDCGGNSGCARCATTHHCIVADDCDHAQCVAGSCQPTSCVDGVTNGTETDRDCGGSCGGCTDQKTCLIDGDCASRVCTGASGARHCATPTCLDGVLNGQESSLDCGSPCSTKCQIADTCFTKNDCASGVCTNTHCLPMSATGKPINATGWLATASNTENTNTPPRFALDGNQSTHWATGTGQLPGMWFDVDMLKPQVFYSLHMTTHSQPSDYPKTMRLTASVDGKTFTELRTQIAGEEDLTITFPSAQYARYLHFQLLDSTNGLWWRIDDLLVLQ